jgi:hypothetical protein
MCSTAKASNGTDGGSHGQSLASLVDAVVQLGGASEALQSLRKHLATQVFAAPVSDTLSRAWITCQPKSSCICAMNVTLSARHGAALAIAVAYHCLHLQTIRWYTRVAADKGAAQPLTGEQQAAPMRYQV